MSIYEKLAFWTELLRASVYNTPDAIRILNDKPPRMIETFYKIGTLPRLAHITNDMPSLLPLLDEKDSENFSKDLSTAMKMEIGCVANRRMESKQKLELCQATASFNDSFKYYADQLSKKYGRFGMLVIRPIRGVIFPVTLVELPPADAPGVIAYILHSQKLGTFPDKPIVCPEEGIVRVSEFHRRLPGLLERTDAEVISFLYRAPSS